MGPEMRTKSPRIASMFGLSLALAGCTSGSPAPGASAPTESATVASHGRSSALDAYVAAERSTIPAIMAANPGMYSDMSISGTYPSTVSFEYRFTDQLEATAAVEYLDSLAPTLQSACDTQVFPSMVSVGVMDSPRAVYTYLNADGSQLWSRTFEKS